ncbi:hypothetical protein CDL15_Pgr012666 [Punica granatum]|uniref:Uncharacterized protein n=1 Tax=Punica granatum TaxID=22663 RepID=A0A218WPD9_PUNGR|nr:hypothetical protein CDL15_Pgr012666 [Punica granatum]
MDRSSGYGSPCRGGRMKVVVGLPVKEADLPPHSKFERAQPRKALVLGEGPAKISIIYCMYGPPRAFFLDLSRAASLKRAPDLTSAAWRGSG